MKRLLILFLFLISQILFAMPPYHLEVVRQGYQITIVFPDIALKNVAVNHRLQDGTPVNETFTKIAIPGFSTSEVIGDPELVKSSFQLALEDEEPVIEISNLIEKKISLKNRVYPLQPPLEYGYHKKHGFLYYNKDAYLKSGERSPYVSVSHVYTYRGQKAAGIAFNPVRYDPINNSLTVAQSFTVTFKMNKPLIVRSRGSREFDKIMRLIFKNLSKETAPGVPSEQFPDREKYLIISNSTYLNNSDLQRFVDFRSSGCEVELVSTSDIGGSDKDAYKSYIRGKMPTYCVLVGSYVDFPTHSYNTTKSYIYYVSSNSSTPKPDIALGLFFIRSSQSLTNLVDKTISTEENLAAIPNHFVAFGGNTQQMGNLPANHCDVIVREMYDDYFEPQGGWEITECYQVNQPRGGKEECTAAMNQGVKFINYNGHGLTSGWTYGNGSWRTSDIGNVSNTIYPFVVSFSCQTGDFTNNSNCWAEYWIGHEHLSTTMVASVTTSTTSMHPFNRGMFKAFGDEMITKFGLMYLYAQNYAYDSISDPKLAVWQFHYFGDPALETMNSDPFISVASPGGGEEWEQGTTQNIKWADNIDGNVKIELFKGGSLKETLASSTESDGSFDWSIAGNYQTGTDYKIKITSIDSSQLFDESDQNFSVIEEYIIKVFPYIEDFDDLNNSTTILPKKWEQLNTDDLQWTVWTGKTPSKEPDQGAATGPDGDNTSGSGNYIYVESSDPNNPDKKADYITCKLGLNYLNEPELSFWYHMFSDNDGQDEMGDIYLDISVDGTWHNDVLHLTNDHGDQWFEQKVDLNNYKGERVILRFRAVTGSGWASDICIDDFKVDGQMAIDNIINDMPSLYSLQFYNSRIHFSIPEYPGNKKLKIGLYNVQGKLVKTLVNGNIKAGDYSIPVNQLATGLYLLKMEAEGFNKTVNIILTK